MLSYHPLFSPPSGLVYGDASKSKMCVMNPEYQVELHMSSRCLDDRNHRLAHCCFEPRSFPTPSLEHSDLMPDSMLLSANSDDVCAAALLFSPFEGSGVDQCGFHDSHTCPLWGLRTIARSTTCGTPHVRSERTGTIVRLCDYRIGLSGERDPGSFCAWTQRGYHITCQR
jgi:hypothetical protein